MKCADFAAVILGMSLLVGCGSPQPGENTGGSRAPARLSLERGSGEVIEITGVAVMAVNDYSFSLHFRGVPPEGPVDLRIHFAAGILIDNEVGRACREVYYPLSSLVGGEFTPEEGPLSRIWLKHWPFPEEPERVAITSMDQHIVSGVLTGQNLRGEFTLPIINGPEVAPCNAEVLAFPDDCLSGRTCKVLQRPLADGDVIFPLENL